MKNFNKFGFILLVCLFHLSSYAQQVGSAIFLVLANDYSSGLNGFNSVSTQSSNTNAALTNPALMTNSQMNVSLNRGKVEIPSFNYDGRYTDIVAYKKIGKQAFGAYFKTSRFTDFDFDFVTDTILGENNSMLGFAYARQFNDKWSIGANVNYYTGQFRNKALAENEGLESYYGFTFSFGGLYQDDVELNDISTLNWSVGANVNNLGHKNSAIPERKDKEFVWSRGSFGTTIGYKRQSEIHPFAVHITLMSQVNYVLSPYRDNNNDGINDYESASALRGVIASFEDIDYYRVDYRTALEVNILLEKDWNFGVRMTYVDGLAFSGNLYPAFFIGYKNFYLSASHSTRISGNILVDANERGVSIGYNVPL